ncbi:hypothetical protein lerEdw1_019577, partial [Lerista edwardsae]
LSQTSILKYAHTPKPCANSTSNTNLKQEGMERGSQELRENKVCMQYLLQGNSSNFVAAKRYT